MGLSHSMKILLLFLGMLHPFAINAEISLPASSVHTYTFESLGWDKAATLNGYRPSATLYFPLAKKTPVQTILLHLILSFSPELIAGTTVDIRFNQTLIRSLDVPSGSNKTMEVDVALPITALSTAWQILQFSSLLKSDKNLCNPDVWVYISPQSSITLQTAQVVFNGTLNELPSPFVDTASLLEAPTQLLLPASPTLEEIITLFHVAFKLGGIAKNREIKLSSRILQNHSIENLQNENLILIGLLPHLIEGTAGLFTDLFQIKALKLQQSSDEGIFLLTASPLNPLHGLLVLSGANNAALGNAAQVFLDKEFTAMASGTFALVSHIHIPTESLKKNYDEMTLKTLGYENKNVSGLGRHYIDFNIPLPNDRIPADMQIETFITTPVFKEQAVSQVTLLVNDQKEASIKLEQDHSVWKVSINPSLMKPGLNKLSYLIDLHLDKSGVETCSLAHYNEVWATLYAQTQMSTSFTNIFPSAMLNQLPVPFETEVTIILPKYFTPDEVNQFSQLFLKLGMLFQANPIRMRFLGSQQATEEFIRNHNVIILGTRENNPWVKFTLDYMPVQLEGQFRYLKLAKKQLRVFGEYSTGLIELMPSPWSEKHAVLLITGEDQAGLSLSIGALIKDSLRSQLQGNIAFINPDGVMTTLNSYENKYLSLTHRVTQYFYNLSKNIIYYIKQKPQIIVYLLVFIVPLIIVFRKRK